MGLLEQNYNAVAGRMLKDYDFTLAISGKKRYGKSTLAQHIAEIVKKAFKKRHKNSKIWLCYSFEELRDAIYNSSKYDIIIADEAVIVLHKHDWNSKESKEINKLVDRAGYKDLFLIMVLPNFWDLNTSFRDNKVNGWLFVHRRGFCKLVAPSRGMFDKHTFWESYGIEQFPRLSPEKEAEYRKLKEKSFDDRGEEVERKDCGVCYQKFQDKLGLTQKEIAHVRGVTREAIAMAEKRSKKRVTR